MESRIGVGTAPVRWVARPALLVLLAGAGALPAAEVPAAEVPAAKVPDASLPAATRAASAPELRELRRGMVVSCPRDGSVWGTPEMDRALEALKPLGVEWIQLHPWGRIGSDGLVTFRPLEATQFLEQGAQKVRDAGFELAWAPHLAWWGSFEWRGAIDFGNDEAAWARFFDSYDRFIVAQAALAQRVGARMFVVGLELEGTTHREREWRTIVGNVRRAYRGEVVYAANWDRLERVPFWDTVDAIGVQAYFPLGDASSGEAELRGAWKRHLAALDALSRRYGKPIVFNEIGYARGFAAASEPWRASLSSQPAAIELRSRLLRAALAELEASELVGAVFWWKWVAGDDRHDRDFSMREPEAVEVLREAWGRRERVSASSDDLATP